MNSSLQREVCNSLFAAAVVVLGTGGVAVAGPTWDLDYTDDALQSAGTAQVIDHALSPYINIYGQLTGYGFAGQGDFVDMYQIEITTQTLVSISTAGGALGGEANFDTQLMIFRRKGGNGNNVRAVAVRANNDAAVGNAGSRIGDELDPSSDYTVLVPGFYYLAVTGVGTDALADNGQLIWPDLGDAGLTVGGSEHYLGNWQGQGTVGQYHVRLHAVGAGGVPAPGALSLLGLAALVKRRRR